MRTLGLAMLGVVLVPAAMVAGPLLATGACAAALAQRRLRRIGAQRSRSRAVEAAMPDAIDMVVLAVRAGHLPAAAISAVLDHLPAAVAPAFREVTQRIASGQRFAEALGALGDELGAAAHPLVDTLGAADTYGLPLAPVLDRLADEARAARRRAVEARVRQLPVRLSMPLVLCTLPSFVLLAVVPLLLGAFSSLHS